MLSFVDKVFLTYSVPRKEAVWRYCCTLRMIFYEEVYNNSQSSNTCSYAPSVQRVKCEASAFRSHSFLTWVPVVEIVEGYFVKIFLSN